MIGSQVYARLVVNRRQILKFNRLVRDFLKIQPETDYIDVFDDMLGQDHKPVLVLFVSTLPVPHSGKNSLPNALISRSMDFTFPAN